MEKKQTAVEWLISQFEERGYDGIVLENVVEQAKQMEKEQIEDAWDDGQECEYQYHINSALKYNSNTYYNETYGGKDE
jgi:hypothetical protein